MLILLVISGIGLIIFILLHSGKGTGISDMIASSVYSTQTGTSIVEKNLDRITIIFAIIFIVSLLVLMVIYLRNRFPVSLQFPLISKKMRLGVMR